MSQQVGQLIISAGESSEPREGVSLVSQVGTQDVVLIATTQHESRCNREITAWQDKLRQAQLDIAELTKQIELSTAKAAAEKLKPSIDKSRDFYSVWGLAFQHEIDTTITELGMIHADVTLFSAKSKSYGDSWTYTNENNFAREFSFAELELTDERKALDNLKKIAAGHEESLRKWRAALAGLGTFERQARASLAAHALASDARGNALVSALLAAANDQVSDLPALTPEIGGSRLLGLAGGDKAVMATASPVVEKPSKTDVKKKRKPAKAKW